MESYAQMVQVSLSCGGEKRLTGLQDHEENRPTVVKKFELRDSFIYYVRSTNGRSWEVHRQIQQGPLWCIQNSIVPSLWRQLSTTPPPHSFEWLNKVWNDVSQISRFRLFLFATSVVPGPATESKSRLSSLRTCMEPLARDVSCWCQSLEIGVCWWYGEIPSQNRSSCIKTTRYTLGTPTRWCGESKYKRCQSGWCHDGTHKDLIP